MQQTLPKTIILRGYQSFTKVISSGVSFQGTLLTGFLLTDVKEKDIEIGFSVPKKRVSLAADRNRIKRLMRESVRKNISDFSSSIKGKNIGVKIVLMYKGEKNKQLRRLTLNDVDMSWIELQQQILKAL